MDVDIKLAQADHQYAEAVVCQNGFAKVLWFTGSLDNLAVDEELSDSLNHLVTYNDNFVVTVEANGIAFDVARRFLVCLNLKEPAASSMEPEPNWSWNEHNELTDSELVVLDQILESHSELMKPPTVLIERFIELLKVA